ncbi:MAG TPA: GAF domain-containing protein [Steroidobacteraceae bacterium]|jgi:GAF domain-containing protein|nr:GAF domain-containing protein [Steroidobacteraceae bacterium]
MHVIESDPSLSKSGLYREISVQLGGLFRGERNGLANCANMSALLYQMLPDLNWVGFYFLQDGELVLGPFQGKVACVRIPMGRGVCGTAAERGEILVVPDVNEFPGHIACDAASRSEIVLPLLQNGRLLGVLDLDSPYARRFDHEDSAGLAVAADLLLNSSDLSKLADDTRAHTP